MACSLSAGRRPHILLVGEGNTVELAAGRLAARRPIPVVHRAFTASLLPPDVDAIYLCTDRQEAAQDQQAGLGLLRAAAAALSAPSYRASADLVIVHGAVAVGTSDWLQHVLSDRFHIAYLATRPDIGSGGPVIGAESEDLAWRVAALEGANADRVTVLDRRSAEMVELTHCALAAAEREVRREVKALTAAMTSSPPGVRTEIEHPSREFSGPESGDSPREVSVVSMLISLADLARAAAPVLRSIVHQCDAASDRFSHVALGRAYLAGLAERSVEAAGPTRSPRGSPPNWYKPAKRGLDLVVGVLGLLLLGPLMLLIALAIMVDSGRPVLFKAKRVGKSGREFEMLKFRSMRLDAPRTANKSETEIYATRIGRILRSTSLDELPQLFNLLTGEMSLVGPRPEQPFVVDWYQPWQRVRLDVSPGLTGWWQVNMRRRGGEMYQHVAYDVWYVRHRSFWLDLCILLRTPSALFGGLGGR